MVLNMRYKTFKKVTHGLCRRCINKQLGTHFKHKQCEFWNFPETCASCKELRNMVIGLHPLSRFKVWFVKAPAKAEPVTEDVTEAVDTPVSEDVKPAITDEQK